MPGVGNLQVSHAPAFSRKYIPHTRKRVKQMLPQKAIEEARPANVVDLPIRPRKRAKRNQPGLVSHMRKIGEISAVFDEANETLSLFDEEDSLTLDIDDACTLYLLLKSIFE